MNWNLATLRDLPLRKRWPVLAALPIAGLLLLAIDYAVPGIQLRPLTFVLVIATTTFGGMRFGMTYAGVAAPAFTLIEWIGAGRALDERFALNVLVATASFAITPLLVVYIQQRMRWAADLENRLRQSQAVRQQLVDVDAARSALARAEANYRAIGESIPFGIWQTDADGLLTYISKSYRELCGMSLEQLADGGWLQRVPHEDAERFLERWRRRDEAGEMFEGEYRLRGSDGRLYAILSRGVRLRDETGKTTGWAGVSLDITDRKRAIDAIALLEEAGRQLMLSLDPPTILERVASVCVPRFADIAAIDMLQEDGSLRNIAIRHVEPQLANEFLEAREGEQKGGARAIETVARTGKSQLAPDRNDGTTMIVPLIARERVLGTLTLAAIGPYHRYDARDLGVAEVLGVRTALAYQNAQHYVREVRVADTLQQASLPQDLPQLPGLRVNATYIPGAAESEVGGDWYDAFLQPDGRIGITIGDVAGKGLRAAVAMGMVRQALRGAALDGLSPADALRRVNRHLCHERTGMVTAVTATLNPSTNELTYSFAGHPPMLIASAGETVEKLQTPGVPLGLFAQTQYVEQTRRLKMGDLIVLYTDGLVEYNRKLLAGERALSDAVLAEVNGDSPNPALAIQERLIEGRPKDDVAILTIALSPAPIDRIDVEAPAVPTSARLLRQALRRLAAGVGMSDDAAFPLLVAAGEAISNAIEHAYGLREGTIHVRGGCADGRLVVEVSDSGLWRAPRDEGRGRGLPLMRSIVDQADVQHAPTGTTVRLAVGLKTARVS